MSFFQKNLKKRNFAKIYTTIAIIAAVALLFNIYIDLPKEVTITEGSEYSYNLIPFMKADTEVNNRSALEISTVGSDEGISLTKPLKILADKVGVYNLPLKLGVIPLKEMKVNVIEPVEVIPCGNTIGIKIQMGGVMVVALSDVKIDGKDYSPARNVGIKVGDIITNIDGHEVNNVDEFTSIIENCGGNALDVQVKRNDKPLSFSVNPIYDSSVSLYKIGTWVRDSASGVGTLTFYMPQKGVFATLGHAITDIDTGEVVEVNSGEITNATITGVRKGERGNPGELKGTFEASASSLGEIVANDRFGVYGKIKTESLFADTKPIPVATRYQIQEGQAFIMANVEGTEIENYEVVIQRITRNPADSNKGLVLKVVDQRLLDKTGGIVQGMSGSPIIQNDKLIGAVTHVFVNDPQRGYGVFIENMIDFAGSL